MSREPIRVHPPQGLPLKMVSAYLDRCRGGLPALHAALDGSDFEAVRVYGHRLRGSGSAYGFAGLTTIGASLEQSASARNVLGLTGAISDLESYLEQVELVAD